MGSAIADRILATKKQLDALRDKAIRQGYDRWREGAPIVDAGGKQRQRNADEFRSLLASENSPVQLSNNNELEVNPKNSLGLQYAALDAVANMESPSAAPSASSALEQRLDSQFSGKSTSMYDDRGRYAGYQRNGVFRPGRIDASTRTTWSMDSKQSQEFFANRGKATTPIVPDGGWSNPTPAPEKGTAAAPAPSPRRGLALSDDILDRLAANKRTADEKAGVNTDETSGTRSMKVDPRYAWNSTTASASPAPYIVDRTPVPLSERKGPIVADETGDHTRQIVAQENRKADPAAPLDASPRPYWSPNVKADNPYGRDVTAVGQTALRSLTPDFFRPSPERTAFSDADPAVATARQSLENDARIAEAEKAGLAEEVKPQPIVASPAPASAAPYPYAGTAATTPRWGGPMSSVPDWLRSVPALASAAPAPSSDFRDTYTRTNWVPRGDGSFVADTREYHVGRKNNAEEGPLMEVKGPSSAGIFMDQAAPEGSTPVGSVAWRPRSDGGWTTENVSDERSRLMDQRVYAERVARGITPTSPRPGTSPSLTEIPYQPGALAGQAPFLRARDAAASLAEAEKKKKEEEEKAKQAAASGKDTSPT